MGAASLARMATGVDGYASVPPPSAPDSENGSVGSRRATPTRSASVPRNVTYTLVVEMSACPARSFTVETGTPEASHRHTAVGPDPPGHHSQPSDLTGPELVRARGAERRHRTPSDGHAISENGRTPPVGLGRVLPSLGAAERRGRCSRAGRLLVRPENWRRRLVPSASTVRAPRTPRSTRTRMRVGHRLCQERG